MLGPPRHVRDTGAEMDDLMDDLLGGSDSDGSDSGDSDDTKGGKQTNKKNTGKRIEKAARLKREADRDDRKVFSFSDPALDAVQWVARDCLRCVNGVPLKHIPGGVFFACGTTNDSGERDDDGDLVGRRYLQHSLPTHWRKDPVVFSPTSTTLQDLIAHGSILDGKDEVPKARALSGEGGGKMREAQQRAAIAFLRAVSAAVSSNPTRGANFSVGGSGKAAESSSDESDGGSAPAAAAPQMPTTCLGPRLQGLVLLDLSLGARNGEGITALSDLLCRAPPSLGLRDLTIGLDSFDNAHFGMLLRSVESCPTLKTLRLDRIGNSVWNKAKCRHLATLLATTRHVEEVFITAAARGGFNDKRFSYLCSFVSSVLSNATARPSVLRVLDIDDPGWSTRHRKKSTQAVVDGLRNLADKLPRLCELRLSDELEKKLDSQARIDDWVAFEATLESNRVRGGGLAQTGSVKTSQRTAELEARLAAVESALHFLLERDREQNPTEKNTVRAALLTSLADTVAIAPPGYDEALGDDA
jgi:hypothetical protein